MIFSVVSPDDPAWTDAFMRLSPTDRDVFHSPAFARATQATLYRRDTVLAAIGAKDEQRVLYPFVLRDLEQLTGACAARGLTDMTGLYGRGGIALSLDGASLLPSFHSALNEWAQGAGAICTFDRFHPVSANEVTIAPGGRVIDVGLFVVMDLRDGADAALARAKPAIRRAIRRAESLGITTRQVPAAQAIDPFLDLYHETMAANGAEDFYFFDRSFFQSLADALGEGAQFHFAFDGDQPVSAELVLAEGRYCHYFLGGTRRQALDSRANQKLKSHIVADCAAQGRHFYLLGGGHDPEDGLTRYKLTFAPDGGLPSRVGGTIFDADAYQNLKARLAEDGTVIRPNRFQFYDPN